MPMNRPMMMRVPDETLAAIDAQAAAEHRDRSGMIRHMIATYLENHASPRKPTEQKTPRKKK